MSRSSNSLRASDVITTPIKLKYTSSYESDALTEVGIRVLTGVNGPVTVTGSIPQETLNYRSVRQLYYANFLTGSNLTTTSSFDCSLQSTAANGTPDVDLRIFPTGSDAEVQIMSIPTGVFGQKVSRFGFLMSSSAYTFVDDGNGNIIDASGLPYVNFDYYSPEFTDWYVYEETPHIGNIIYPQGMVIITNPDYIGYFLQGLSLVWDDINNTPVTANNLAAWNAYFDLPNNGTPFASLKIIGNEVILSGGAGINLKNNIFNGNNNLLEIKDYGAYITSTGTNCFKDCALLTTVILPVLTTTGVSCFENCGSLLTVELPSLITTGENSFLDCVSILAISFPNLITAGDGTFWYCTNLATVDLPLLETAGDRCFRQCLYALTTINLPSATYVGADCFSFSNQLTSVTLPNVTYIGDNCFESCIALTSVSIPSCINLGSSVGDNSVFLDITGNEIALSIPPALLTCNGGNPDGDIQYLQANNTVIFSLTLTFSSTFPVIDPTNYTQWNTFFNLPTNGTPFTSVIVDGYDVILFGGSGITLRNSLFVNNTSLVEINDISSVINVGDHCFSYCTSLTTVNLPGLISTDGGSIFEGCSSLTTVKLPNYSTPNGGGIFAYCTALTTIDLPSLPTVGGAWFIGCTALTTVNLPNVVGLSIGNGFAFQDCTSLTTLYTPLCTNLGDTVGNNNIFLNITGQTITLTIDSSIATCNSGGPDGDITYLTTNNPGSTVVYV